MNLAHAFVVYSRKSKNIKVVHGADRMFGRLILYKDVMVRILHTRSSYIYGRARM